MGGWSLTCVVGERLASKIGGIWQWWEVRGRSSTVMGGWPQKWEMGGCESYT